MLMILMFLTIVIWVELQVIENYRDNVLEYKKQILMLKEDSEAQAQRFEEANEQATNEMKKWQIMRMP